MIAIESKSEVKSKKKERRANHLPSLISNLI